MPPDTPVAGHARDVGFLRRKHLRGCNNGSFARGLAGGLTFAAGPPGEPRHVLVLTALLASLRADELRQADVGDIRTTDDGAAVIHVKGKGGKQRSVPIEA
jgi:integrase